MINRYRLLTVASVLFATFATPTWAQWQNYQQQIQRQQQQYQQQLYQQQQVQQQQQYQQQLYQQQQVQQQQQYQQQLYQQQQAQQRAQQQAQYEAQLRAQQQAQQRQDYAPRVVQPPPPLASRDTYTAVGGFVGNVVGAGVSSYTGVPYSTIGIPAGAAGSYIGGNVYDTEQATRYYSPPAMGTHTTTPYRIVPPPR